MAMSINPNRHSLSYSYPTPVATPALQQPVTAPDIINSNSMTSIAASDQSPQSGSSGRYRTSVVYGFAHISTCYRERPLPSPPLSVNMADVKTAREQQQGKIYHMPALGASLDKDSPNCSQYQAGKALPFYDDDLEADDSEIDNSAIDDDDSDWEDSSDDCGSRNNEKTVFQRVDSRLNLTSRKSFITLLRQNDRLANVATASTSSPASQESCTSLLNGPSPAVLPGANDGRYSNNSDWDNYARLRSLDYHSTGW